MANEGALRTPGSGESIAADLDEHGQKVQKVGQMIWTGTEWKRLSGNATDGASAAEELPVANLLLNSEGTLDRQRRNQNNKVGLPMAARTAEATVGVTNYNGTKLHVDLIINKSGEGSISLSLLDQVPEFLANFVKIVGTGGPLNARFQVAPGLPTSAGSSEAGQPAVFVQTANLCVPSFFELRVTPTGASIWEYELLYSLMV
jgi:hypothetical protein